MFLVRLLILTTVVNGAYFVLVAFHGDPTAAAVTTLAAPILVLLEVVRDIKHGTEVER